MHVCATVTGTPFSVLLRHSPLNNKHCTHTHRVAPQLASKGVGTSSTWGHHAAASPQPTDMSHTLWLFTVLGLVSRCVTALSAVYFFDASRLAVCFNWGRTRLPQRLVFVCVWLYYTTLQDRHITTCRTCVLVAVRVAVAHTLFLLAPTQSQADSHQCCTTLHTSRCTARLSPSCWV